MWMFFFEGFCFFGEIESKIISLGCGGGGGFGSLRGGEKA